MGRKGMSGGFRQKLVDTARILVESTVPFCASLHSSMPTDRVNKRPLQQSKMVEHTAVHISSSQHVGYVLLSVVWSITSCNNCITVQEHLVKVTPEVPFLPTQQEYPAHKTTVTLPLVH